MPFPGLNPKKELSLGSTRMVALALAAGTLAGAAPAQADTDVTVCNQAENSHRGGYVLTDGPEDPTPPAFHRGSPMRLGDGAGLEHAAEVSPALRECEPEVGNPDV
jgi:hypothetical protein